MCTGIRLVNADGTTVHGRTGEFALPLDLEVIYIPAGYQNQSSLGEHGPGMRWISTYAVVGASCFGENMVADGMNEAGLSIGAHYFAATAAYQPVADHPAERSLNAAEFATWLLSTCASVDEVRANLDQVTVVDAVVAAWGGVPPFHWAVYDKTGTSIIIEPIDGTLQVHDNPIGTITNDPDFRFHRQNLAQYLNVDTMTIPSSDRAGTTITGFGTGSGALGLPGDFTSPSRFVRASFFANNHPAAANSTDGVHEVFHILNQFDVPRGFVLANKGDGEVHIEWTLATFARDPSTGSYYFRSYGDQTIRKIVLADVKAVPGTVLRQPVGPDTGDFTPVPDTTAAFSAAG